MNSTRAFVKTGKCRTRGSAALGLLALPGNPGMGRIATTSSKMLAEQFHLDSAQIRKDLAISASLACVVSAMSSKCRAAAGRDPGSDCGREVCVVGGEKCWYGSHRISGFSRSGFSVVRCSIVSSSKIGTRRQERCADL